METSETQSLFTQKTPKARKKQFFKITMALAIVIVLILLYKTFASTGVGTANNISLNYDTNTITLLPNKEISYTKKKKAYDKFKEMFKR